jgi:hypothetical protein
MKYTFKSVLLTILVATLLSKSASSQVVRSLPLFPSDNDNVTVFFDATQGNGALAGVAPPIYAHTGVLTNLSTSPTDWRHVQGIWGQASPNTLMIPQGNNLYSISFTPRVFYGVPAADTLRSLAFVFRNTNGSIVGREANGGDIYLPLYAAGQLHSRIFTPSAGSPLVNVGSTIPFLALLPRAVPYRFTSTGPCNKRLSPIPYVPTYPLQAPEIIKSFLQLLTAAPKNLIH